MKKLVTILTTVLMFTGFGVVAQEDERFRRGEWDVSPFATYVDKIGDDWGAGASVTYFITDKIGIGAVTYWTDFEGTFIDNMSAEAYFRLPLFKIVAPYGVGSLGYQFDSEELIASLGGGVDFRAFKRVSMFSDIQWRFAEDTRDGVFLRFGARFAF